MERKRPGKERKKEKLLNLSARGLGFRPAKELARVIEEKGPFTRGDDVLFYTELYIVSLRFLSNSAAYVFTVARSVHGVSPFFL